MTLKKVFFLSLTVLLAYSGYAQDEFCDAIGAISRDAPNKFRNVRGNPMNGGNMWACGIKVPGTISSRFVASMGLFYEGALFQSKNMADIGNIYGQYKKQLMECLGGIGYTMSEQANFFPGMKDYKKLVFMPAQESGDGMPPSHVTMEAMYNKQVGSYTIVMYIFEH